MFDHMCVHPAGEVSTTNETMSVYKQITALTSPPVQAGDGAVWQLNGTHNFIATQPQ